MSEKYGIPTTTVYRYVSKGGNLIFTQRCKFIQLPQTIEEFQLLSNKSLEKSPLQGSALFVDGTHINVIGPAVNTDRFFNRKGVTSCNWLIVCDSFRIIRYFSGPYFGSSHDSFVFKLSGFYDYVENNIPQEFFTIGDSAYPEMNHLRRPYKGVNLNNDEIRFNENLSKQRMIVENTIGDLKNKFKNYLIESLKGVENLQQKA